MAETTTIMVRMDGRSIQRNIERIKFARDHAEVGTQEYETLSNELMKEYEILRKYKDSRFYVDPKVLATLLVVGGIAFFAICLDQENPKAIKIAQFITKLFKFG